MTATSFDDRKFDATIVFSSCDLKYFKNFWTFQNPFTTTWPLWSWGGSENWILGRRRKLARYDNVSIREMSFLQVIEFTWGMTFEAFYETFELINIVLRISSYITGKQSRTEWIIVYYFISLGRSMILRIERNVFLLPKPANSTQIWKIQPPL